MFIKVHILMAEGLWKRGERWPIIVISYLSFFCPSIFRECSLQQHKSIFSMVSHESASLSQDIGAWYSGGSGFLEGNGDSAGESASAWGGRGGKINSAIGPNEPGHKTGSHFACI